MKTGLERLAKIVERPGHFGRVGLVCNQASVDCHVVPSWKICAELFKNNLTTLFGPQHGFESTVQDNMIETGHATHAPTGLPVYSLYSETREPTKDMLQNVDTIIVDLQITGTRVYTYKYTLAACLRAAKAHDKKVVVLDRPNPLGGEIIEGRVLHEDARSFVGEFAIPMRHGLTPGEAAFFFNKQIEADLEVVWMDGWDPAKMWHELERPWVLTSPNLPTPDSLFVYPGMVAFEGVNMSEGRGTTRPFQLIGAPYIKDAISFKQRIIDLLGGEPAGLYLRPTVFQPCFQKWSDQVCQGVDLIVTDPQKVRSYELALCIIRAGFELGGQEFGFVAPGYEYNNTDLPIQLILGHLESDQYLVGQKFDRADPFWREGHREYKVKVESILHYERTLRSQD